MENKDIKAGKGKQKKNKIVTIIAIVCAIDVVVTLIYYYASGAFKF